MTTRVWTLDDATGVPGWDEGAGGGSQPVDVVRTTISFNTADLNATMISRAITAVDDVAKTFTVAGSHVADYVAGQPVTVLGSTGNDAFYTIVGATLDSGNTVVEVQQNVSDPTADGNLRVQTGGGIVVYEPDDGAVLLGALTTASITTAWDEEADLRLMAQGDKITGGNGNDIAYCDLTAANDPKGSGGAYPADLIGALFVCNGAPLILIVDDGFGGTSEATEGEGSVTLIFLPVTA